MEKTGDRERKTKIETVWVGFDEKIKQTKTKAIPWRCTWEHTLIFMWHLTRLKSVWCVFVHVCVRSVCIINEMCSHFTRRKVTLSSSNPHIDSWQCCSVVFIKQTTQGKSTVTERRKGEKRGRWRLGEVIKIQFHK